jgi:hypothetical protein
VLLRSGAYLKGGLHTHVTAPRVKGSMGKAVKQRECHGGHALFYSTRLFFRLPIDILNIPLLSVLAKDPFH